MMRTEFTGSSTWGVERGDGAARIGWRAPRRSRSRMKGACSK